MKSHIRIPPRTPHWDAYRWNKAHRIGTPVRELAGKRKGRISRTISEAWVNAAGETVVRLSGRFSGSSESCVPLSSVVPAFECLVLIGGE